MLKFGNHAKNLMDLLSDKAKEHLLGSKLTTKTHEMSIGFDAPQNPATVLNLNAWVVGKKFTQVEKYMRTTYTEFATKEDMTDESNMVQYYELKIKMQDQASAKEAAE